MNTKKTITSIRRYVGLGLVFASFVSARAVDISVTGSMNNLGANGAGITNYFSGVMGVFMLICFLLCVSLAVIAILEFIKHGMWDKIQNKIIGLVFFFALSIVIYYFKAQEISGSSAAVVPTTTQPSQPT